MRISLLISNNNGGWLGLNGLWISKKGAGVAILGYGIYLARNENCLKDTKKRLIWYELILIYR